MFSLQNVFLTKPTFTNQMKIKSFLFAILPCLMILSCTSPTKDFNLHINPTFYKYVVEVELFDITNPTVQFSDNLTIEITGEDAAGVYNIDGTKNFEINFGSLQLIIARNFQPTSGNPIDFQVKLTSNTYQEVTLPISVGETDYFKKVDLGMLDPSNLPDGITNATGSGSLASSGQLNQPVNFVAGTNDSLSKVEITIPTDITFMDADGNQVNGSQLDISVLSLSDTTLAGQQALPNGGGAIQTLTINGTQAQILMPPSSTFKVDMNIDGNSVKSFSGNGIQMKMDIPSIMFNDEANRNYQAGDSIALISSSDGDASWESDGVHLVQDDGQGNLFIDASVKHLSFRKLFLRSFIRSFPTLSKKLFTVNASLPTGTDASVSGTMDLRFSYKTSPSSTSTISFARTVTATLSTTKQNIFTESILTFASGTPELTVTVGKNGTFNSTLYTIGNTTQAGTLETDLVFTPNGSGVDVSFSLYCEGSSTIINPPAGVKMFYKESNIPNIGYTHLYTFTEANVNLSTGRVYQLDDGKSYDFRALFNAEQVDTNNVLIEDGKHYQVTLPQSACDEIL